MYVCEANKHIYTKSSILHQGMNAIKVSIFLKPNIDPKKTTMAGSTMEHKLRMSRKSEQNKKGGEEGRRV